MSMTSCGDVCGWMAALVSCISFGTFGVPIKGDAANSVDVDPLVFQSYKTAMCLLTSPIVLILSPEYFAFTPWGIVSGFFWVPAGVAAIYAVRSAGLAVSQGTWSSVIVLISFVWGIGIFGESVRSLAGACVAVALMIVGLWGMSFYSSPEASVSEAETSMTQIETMESSCTRIKGRRHRGYQGVKGSDTHEMVDIAEETDRNDVFPGEDGSTCSPSNGVIELTQNAESDRVTESSSPAISNRAPMCDHVLISGYRFSRRQLGLASAIFNGVWGGSIMVPMHYARGNTSGLGYVISFAVGATVVTAFLWLCRLSYQLLRTRPRCSIAVACRSLPAFHFRVMWLPGGIAGTLWSVGNICSMVSVEYLGEGVGYSVVQASMLISGLWGIFWFREVVGIAARAKWLAAALITIAGVLMLSYEHVHTG